MRQDLPGLALLSAMITPAVLISACGALVFSTSSRLARIVDRARKLAGQVEALAAGEIKDFAAERRIQVDRQLTIQARRVRLIQNAMASLYVALGTFVATTIAIGLTYFAPKAGWLPAAFGILGTLILFYGCLLLIRETRLAIRAVTMELEFAQALRVLYEQRGPGPENKL